jgi:hypothetical protein
MLHLLPSFVNWWHVYEAKLLRGRRKINIEIWHGIIREGTYVQIMHGIRREQDKEGDCVRNEMRGPDHIQHKKKRKEKRQNMRVLDAVRKERKGGGQKRKSSRQTETKMQNIDGTWRLTTIQTRLLYRCMRCWYVGLSEYSPLPHSITLNVYV